MTGRHETTYSPSSSKTSRSTPWVEGCWGPMLMIMVSSRTPRSATVTALSGRAADLHADPVLVRHGQEVVRDPEPWIQTRPVRTGDVGEEAERELLFVLEVAEGRLQLLRSDGHGHLSPGLQDLGEPLGEVRR